VFTLQLADRWSLPASRRLIASRRKASIHWCKWYVLFTWLCELTLDLQWQRKSQLAFYHPSTFSRVQPPLQTYTDVQLPPDPNLFSPPPEVAPSLASFYAPSLDDPTPYSDPAYVYSMPSSLPAQMHPSPPQLPRPYNGQTMPMPAPHAYGQHPIMPPTQSFFWSDNGEQFWTTEDHVHAGLVMGQDQMPKDG
jgi:hypothetical protein